MGFCVGQLEFRVRQSQRFTHDATPFSTCEAKKAARSPEPRSSGRSCRCWHEASVRTEFVTKYDLALPLRFVGFHSHLCVSLVSIARNYSHLHHILEILQCSDFDLRAGRLGRTFLDFSGERIFPVFLGGSRGYFFLFDFHDPGN